MTEFINKNHDLLFFFASVWVVVGVGIAIVYCLRKLKAVPKIERKPLFLPKGESLGL